MNEIFIRTQANPLDYKKDYMGLLLKVHCMKKAAKWEYIKFFRA